MKHFLIIFSLLLGVQSWAIDPINAVVGDVSYMEKFGTPPTHQTDDLLRIQTHLEYIEKLLRATQVDHLTDEARENRMALLGDLHAYWTAGKFPQIPVYFESRRPCFIDDEGTLCAVGYLLTQTEGLAVAREINEKHRFEYLLDMNDPVLELWAQKNGFSLTELAMIQPTYDTPRKPVRIELKAPPRIEVPIEEVLRNQLITLQMKYDSVLVDLEHARAELGEQRDENEALQEQMKQERAEAASTIQRKKRWNYVWISVASSLGATSIFQWVKMRNVD